MFVRVVVGLLDAHDGDEALPSLSSLPLPLVVGPATSAPLRRAPIATRGPASGAVCAPTDAAVRPRRTPAPRPE